MEQNKGGETSQIYLYLTFYSKLIKIIIMLQNENVNELNSKYDLCTFKINLYFY